MAYKFELPVSSWVHPIYHVSFLKKVIGDKISIQTIFPELDEEGEVILELEKYLKQGPNNNEPILLLSTSSNGRTYQ